MKKIYRILKITGVFFAFLLSVSYIWFLIESAISPEINNVAYMDYLLYLLGYGELDIPDLFGKSFFSIIGLLSLTLLSSVFTVSLFDWRSKLILSDRIVVWDKNPTTHLASALLRCKQRDIYNIRINLIVHCEKDTYSEEYYIPLIPKNTSHFVDFEIAPGTALYKYLRLYLRTNNTTVEQILLHHKQKFIMRSFILQTMHLKEMDIPLLAGLLQKQVAYLIKPISSILLIRI